MIEIAISSDAPHFNQEHVIFGEHYVIEFEWIEREAYWAMHLYDGAENPLVIGVRLIPQWPIVIDKNAKVLFLLIAKRQNAALSLSSLRTDFTLVACEFV